MFSLIRKLFSGIWRLFQGIAYAIAGIFLTFVIGDSNALDTMRKRDPAHDEAKGNRPRR